MKKILLFKISFIAVFLLSFLTCGINICTASTEHALTAGVSDDVPPVCFRDAQSKLIGFDVDLLYEIGKRISRPIDFKIIDWNKKFDDLIKDKSIDFIASNLSITDERKKIIIYTDPLIHNAQSIIVNASSPIRSKSDIGGKKICLLDASNSIPLVEKYAEKSGLSISFSFSTTHGCLNSLVSQEVEAAVMDLVPITYYAQHNPGQFRILEEDFGKDDLAYGLRPADTALREQLNQAIRSIQADGTMQILRERWFGRTK